jgi:hypothetical protein
MLDSFLLKAEIEPEQEVLQLNPLTPLEWLMVKIILGYISSLAVLIIIAAYLYHMGMQLSMLAFLFFVGVGCVSLLFYILKSLITGRRFFAHF